MNTIFICHTAVSGRFQHADVRSTAAYRIEVLNVRPPVKKVIILLLHRADIKVLNDALAHLGPYQTLMWARCSDPGR